MPDADMRQSLAIEYDVLDFLVDSKVDAKDDILALDEEVHRVVCDAGEMLMRFQGLSL